MLLSAYLLTQYGDTLWIPFINEDYAFLDMVRDHSLLSLWGDPGLYVGPWFRPWSQGFHYWSLQNVIGHAVQGWHVVSLALTLAILLLYLSLVRQIAGREVAAVATACATALTGWGTLVTWIAAVQDLWMLVFALLALHAIHRGQSLLAALALGLALASKETAIILPGLALAWNVGSLRLSLKQALGRTRPLWTVALVWFVLHPSLGASQWFGPRPNEPLDLSASLDVAGKLLPAVFNLDRPVQVEYGWGGPLVRGLLGALCLAALAWWGLWQKRLPARPEEVDKRKETGLLSRTRVAVLGTFWAVLGWVPLLLPSLDWHSYYSLFGMLGAWMAIGVLLCRPPRVLIYLVIVILAVTRAGRAATPNQDWGEESYIRRAGEFLVSMRQDLQSKYPSPQPHSRLYFDAVPSGVGFLIGDGPVLRVWYGNPTLSGGFYRDFRARDAGKPKGEDRFFRYDLHAGWIEVVLGPEDLEIARRRNPRWAMDQELVALALGLGGDFYRSEAEYAKLAAAFPDTFDYPYYASLAAAERGDSVAAQSWRARALAIQRKQR